MNPEQTDHGPDLRNSFAGQAMQAMIASQFSIDDPPNLVKEAYNFADLMLAERARRNNVAQESTNKQ